jgi:hypothetical protein
LGDAVYSCRPAYALCYRRSKYWNVN